MKHIKVSGCDYSIGFQHGQACRDEINVGLNTYKYMFREVAGLEWDAVREIASREFKRLNLLMPGCCREIDGIACGSGFDLLDIMALNIRSEILFSLGCQQATDGCTSIAVMPCNPEQKHALLAQNWDWLESQRSACVVLTVEPEQGVPYLTVTEAGIVAKVGFNAAGIGVCLNALSVGYGADGIPIHFHLREILRKQRLTAAMDQIIKNPHSCAAHYLIASREGMAFGLEATPSQVAVLSAENGTVIHSNHLLHKRHSQVYDFTPKVMGASSYIRLEAVRQAISHRQGLTHDDIKKILSSHDSYPEGVCQHPSGEAGICGKIASAFSIVMDLEKLSAAVCLGNPCESEYVQYRLDA